MSQTWLTYITVCAMPVMSSTCKDSDQSLKVKVDMWNYRLARSLLPCSIRTATRWRGRGNLLCSESNNRRHRTWWIVLAHSAGMSYSRACWDCRSTPFPSTGYRGGGGGCVWCARVGTFIYNNNRRLVLPLAVPQLHPRVQWLPLSGHSQLTFTYGDHFMICSVSCNLSE